LRDHRGWDGRDDEIDAAAKQQLAQNETGLDGFTEADIIGNHQIDAWQLQCLAQRLELIRLGSDACPERRLKQVRVGCSDTAPAHCSGIGSEELRVVEALLADATPAGVFDYARVKLVFPKDRDRLALRVVVDGCGMDKTGFSQPRGLLDSFN
jgi:hypothetical protein